MWYRCGCAYSEYRWSVYTRWYLVVYGGIRRYRTALEANAKIRYGRNHVRAASCVMQIPSSAIPCFVLYNLTNGRIFKHEDPTITLSSFVRKIVVNKKIDEFLISEVCSLI